MTAQMAVDTDWHGFLGDWMERAVNDRRVRVMSSGVDVPFTLRNGDYFTWIHLCEGQPLEYASDEAFDRRVDFGLEAPPEVWSKLWAPIPPPRHQSMFALLSKVPEFHVEGSREALAQHAHVVARLLELARPPADVQADGAPADLSAVSGRYVPVTLSTGEAQLFAEQSGAGRELLLLHTAG